MDLEQDKANTNRDAMEPLQTALQYSENSPTKKPSQIGKVSKGDQRDDSIPPTDKELIPLTRKDYIVITSLCMINLFANSAYSSIAPFYPTEAVQKGVPVGVLGIIFSGYSISMVIFTPLFAHLLYKYGNKKVLVAGCLSEGIAMILFGLFDYVDSPTSYACLSFLCRFIEGFGNGCLNSGSSNVLMTNYPHRLSQLTGLQQSFTGIGMLCGPLIGSILYSIGGFQLPFYFVGVLLCLLAFVVGQTIDDRRNLNEMESKVFQGKMYSPQSQITQGSRASGQRRDRVSLRKLITQYNILTCALCMTTSLLCLTFKEPILQLGLQKDYDLGVAGVASVFAIDTIAYTIISACLNLFPESKKTFSRIQFLGIILFFFSSLLMGPAPFLPNKLYIVCIGVALGGSGGALVNNNTPAAMFQIKKVDDPKANEELLKANISAINTGAFGLGSILGPLLGSFLSGKVGFNMAFFILAMLVIPALLLHFHSQYLYRSEYWVKSREQVQATHVRDNSTFSAKEENGIQSDTQQNNYQELQQVDHQKNNTESANH